MALPVEIVSPRDKIPAQVTNWGELVTGDLSPSTASFAKMEVANTGYNYIVPKAGCDIFITGFHLYANKSVGANDATVIIYANGTSGTDLTTAEILFESEIPKYAQVTITGIKLKVTERGMWVNGKTDDDDVFATIFYYYAASE